MLLARIAPIPTSALSAIALALFHSVTAVGQDIRLDVGDTKPDRRWVVLPFVFSTDSLQTAYGISGGTSGFYQPQMSTFVAVLGSSNDTTAMFLSINDYQFQGSTTIVRDIYRLHRRLDGSPHLCGV